MRFIFGANIPNSHTTGMGRQMHGLGDALVARGHEVRYVFAEDVPNRSGRRWGRIEYPLRLAHAVLRIAGGSGDQPIALLHEPVGWPSAAFLRGRVRTIAMVHNCESKCWERKLATRSAIGESVALSSRILWPLTELSQAYLSLKAASKVVCLSSEDVDYLTGRFGLAPGRVHRIDNGLEADFLGLPAPGTAERDILFLGHWLPHKGTKFLVAALRELARRGIFGKLTLAGTSSTPEAIRADLPPEWRPLTEVLPYVPPDGLVDVYRRHRIFVLPSIWEGIPLALLEAMACGLHPIASRVGGIRDVVQEGRTGTLVPSLQADSLADALALALRSPDDVRASGRAAQLAMQEYGWSRVAIQLEAVCGIRS